MIILDDLRSFNVHARNWKKMKVFKPILYEEDRMLLKYNDTIQSELGKMFGIDIIFTATLLRSHHLRRLQ